MGEGVYRSFVLLTRDGNLFKDAKNGFKVVITNTSQGKYLEFQSVPNYLANAMVRIELPSEVKNIVSLNSSLKFKIKDDQFDSIRLNLSLNYKPQVIKQPVLKYISIAAAILIGLPMGLYFYTNYDSHEKDRISKVIEIQNPNDTLSKDTNEHKPVIEKNQSRIKDTVNQSKLKANTDLLAENFVGSQMLESFTDQKYRSTIKVELLTPANGDTVKIPVQFSWKASRQSRWKIVLLNNQDHEILTENIDSTSFLMKHPLNPGLYYWKLSNGNETIAVKKFYIVK